MYNDIAQKLFALFDISVLEIKCRGKFLLGGKFKICFFTFTYIFMITSIVYLQYHFTDIIKVFFMVADVRLITPDQNGITDGEIPIFDMAGFSLRHLTKVVLSSLRCYMKYTQVRC